MEPLVPPKYPKYLDSSSYAELVQRQYELRLAAYSSDKHRESADPTPILVNSAVRKPKVKSSGQPFHLSLDNADKLEDLDLKLPTAWNPNDKGHCVELSSDNRRLKYVGVGKDDTDAASVRANFPMRPQCGIFYFEVEIVSKGRDGYIGIGFCWQSNLLNRLPGWDDHSWGYHGDDGHSFCSSGNGKPYGPKFGTGDTIGCGVNFQDMSAFYTKNGVDLGTAFQGLQGASLYPCVGFRTPGEQVEVNFGEREFKFDIEHYVKVRERGKDDTSKPSSPAPPPRLNSIDDMESSKILHEVVLSYMVHHGFSDSAKTFAKDISESRKTDSMALLKDSSMDTDPIDLIRDEQDIQQRQEIRHALMAGDVDKAINLCEEHYPSVLDDNDMLMFKLECHKFIELMRQYAEQQGFHPKLARSCSSSTKSAIDTYVPARERMDLDDVPVPQQRGYKRRRSIHEEEDSVDSLSNNDDDEEDDDSEDDEEDSLDGLLGTAMTYGQQLQQNYGRDERPEVQSTLVETFSLIAYRDPFQSPVAHVLDDLRRDELVNQLNSAILVSRNLPGMPRLEHMYKQTQVAIQELLFAGNGKAAMMDLRKDVL
ncbi:concanavalin A-like lectin/glucanase domain-containing protein [Umbelopsis sp. AD052]|nr:concanavalin A-like lectin/glucanase domain-containing protein [Umbelopsis sp. AD052]